MFSRWRNHAHSRPDSLKKRRACITCLSCTIISLAGGISAKGQAAPPSNPASDWQKVAPESVGYSSARLEALRMWLRTQQTTAMMVVVEGKIIFQYGDIAHNSKIASVRKSVLSMLYGNYVANGKIDLNKTVKQIGLQDNQPFLPAEENATLLQLLTARSGIYLPSGNTELDNVTPKRGSVPPSTTFAYNNWDFNAAGTAFEKLTGKDIFDALETDLARPLQMQDFDRSLQRKIPSPASVHPEYAMYLSVRDMGRLGVLMLNGCNWNGKQLIPADWCGWSTSVTTHWPDLNPIWLKNPGQPDRWGYGMLWWVWDAPAFPGNLYSGPYQGAFSAMGSGGQFITVFPRLGMVVVHKVDIDKDANASVNAMDYDTILNMVIDSHCSGACK